MNWTELRKSYKLYKSGISFQMLSYRTWHLGLLKGMTMTQRWERDLLLIGGRIVIPKSLRRKVLHCLHSAHQGMGVIKARTNDTDYWPGTNIWNFRSNCSICALLQGSYQNPSPWPRMAIPTNSDGHIPHSACSVPCLCRFTNWLSHFVPLKTRSCQHI